MKFNVNAAELTKLLKTVIKGFDQKDDRSYVSVFVNGADDTVQFTSRSEAALFQGKLPVTKKEINPGEATSYLLDGAKLRELATAIGTAPIDVEFSIDEKSRIFTVRTTRNQFKLPVMGSTTPEGVPTYQEVGSIYSNDFISSIKSLTRIIDNDKSVANVATSCLHLKFEDGLVLLATNGYSLGERKLEFTPESKVGETVLIRNSGISLLTNAFNDDELLTLIATEGMFGYVDEDGVIALVGIIDLEPLSPASIKALVRDENKATVETSELKAAVELVNRLSFNDDRVQLSFVANETEITVSNTSGDQIQLASSVPVLNTGSLFLDTSIILESISAVTTKNVQLAWDLWDDAGVVKSQVLRLIEVDDVTEESLTDVSTIVAIIHAQ